QNTRVAKFFRDRLNEDFLEILNKKRREKKNKFFLINSKNPRQFQRLQIPSDINEYTSFSHDILKTMCDIIDETGCDEDLSDVMLLVINAQVNKIINLGENDDLLGIIILTTKDQESNIKSKYKYIKNGGVHALWGRVVNNGLAVSRTIGYRGFKDGREVNTTKGNIQKGDILIFACDGVWDVMEHEEVAAFVQEKLDEFNEKYLAKNINLNENKEKRGGNKQLNLVAKALEIRAREKGSNGDISVLIFRPPTLEIASIEENDDLLKDEYYKN
ncbi:MAG: hypothetical protein WCD44_00550, partial [Candidatus Babeliales bacterium]